MQFVIVALLLFISALASADVFIWTNESGTPEIWGTPPIWYRNAEYPKSPRTQFFINGKLEDDTVRPVSKSEAKWLRKRATDRAIATFEQNMLLRAEMHRPQVDPLITQNLIKENLSKAKEKDKEKPPAPTASDIVEGIKNRVK